MKKIIEIFFFKYFSVDAHSGVIMRKHPKQSLSQPTIPEEEGEEAINEALTSTVTSISSSLTSGIIILFFT